MAALIVVPDDFPSRVRGLGAPTSAPRASAQVRVVSERGADQEAELIAPHRATPACAINIRAHARFSDGVFVACPDLKMVSVWGTGTDNIDLDAAGMRGAHRLQHARGQRLRGGRARHHPDADGGGRHDPQIDREMHAAARWPREMLTQCLGKTLGVFGMGTIGARVVAARRGIGMDVLAWSAPAATRRASAATGARAAPAGRDPHARRTWSACTCAAAETRGFLGRKRAGHDEAHRHPREHRPGRAGGSRGAASPRSARGTASWAPASTSSTRGRWPPTIRS